MTLTGFLTFLSGSIEYRILSARIKKNTLCSEFCIYRHSKQLIHRGGEQIEFSGVGLEKSLWKVSGNQDLILLGVLLWLGRHNYSEYLNMSKLFGFQSLEQVGMLGWGSDGWTLEVSRLGSFNLDDHWMERSQSSELFQNSFLIRRSLETKNSVKWKKAKSFNMKFWNPAKLAFLVSRLFSMGIVGRPEA